MRNRDAQVREIFHHVRQTLHLIEDILFRNITQDVEQKQRAQLHASERSVPELPQKMAYSIKEVVTLFGIGRSSIYREISEGRLRVIKLGKRSLVLRTDLDEWMKKLPGSRPDSRRN